jgi:ABC-type bacteriocin/lantibiotic exporter with double-glycine peptidase domain
MEMTECGAACLVMAMATQGIEIPLAEVRSATNVSRDGTSAWAILRAARDFGFEANAVQAELADLAFLPRGTILHWSFAHFVVLERVFANGDAMIVDPAIGRFRARREELDRNFTGIAITIERTAATPYRRTRAKRFSRYLRAIRPMMPAFRLVMASAVTLQVLTAARPLIGKILFDTILHVHAEVWFVAGLASLAVMALMRHLLLVVRGIVSQRLQMAVDAVLFENFVEHLFNLPFAFFLQRRPGDLLSRVQSNSVIRATITERSVSGILDGSTLVSYLVVAAYLSPKSAIILLIFLLVRTALEILPRDLRAQAVAGELTATGGEATIIADACRASETARASGAEWRLLERWSARFVERTNAGLSRRRIDATLQHGALALSTLTAIAVIWFAGIDAIAGGITLGAFIALAVIVAGAVQSAESLVIAVRQFSDLRHYLARLGDITDAELAPSGTREISIPRGGIDMRRVSFRHAGDSPFVLHEIELAIEPDELVAIVGPIGSGKSTLLSLMLGVYRPTEGDCLIDGVPTSALSSDARRQYFGAALQNAHLFSGTLRDNLAMGKALTDEDLLRAAKIACLDDVVMRLPDGFDTLIGEKGWTMSGGERQRLCIARSVAANPKILLLDEPTSSLDSELARELLSNVAALACTRVIVSHDLRALDIVDRVIAIDKGRVLFDDRPSRLRFDQRFVDLVTTEPTWGVRVPTRLAMLSDARSI